MPQRKRQRRSRPVLGDIYPGGLLTKEGCMRRCGLGRSAIQEARRSGMVTPIVCNQRLYYRTDELIAWIKSHAMD